MHTYDQVLTDDARAMLAHVSIRHAEAEHRIANSLQFLSATLDMHVRAVSDPTARTVLLDVQQRLIAMGSLHRLLQHHGSDELVELQDFLKALVTSLRKAWVGAARGALLQLSCPSVWLGAERAIALAMIASELVCNALKYAYPVGKTGEIRVIVTAAEGTLTLSVQDDGQGIGHPSDAPSGGQGDLIIRSLAAKIDATVDRIATPDGICVLESRAINLQHIRHV